MKRLLVILLALLSLALCAAARAESPLIMDGTWGTCAWELREDGVLKVYPGTGADTGGVSPWYTALYGSKAVQYVKKIELSSGVVLPADCSYLFAVRKFAGCPSLTICAPAGGSVEAYAKAHRLSFIER